MSICFPRCRGWIRWLPATWLLAPYLAFAAGPTIQHEPVTMALADQPISILAKVSPGSAPVQSVVLHYSQSRDASPVKQLMTPSGDDMYVATIPAQHLGGSPTVHYYIEVIDRSEEWAETTWHQVQIRGEKAPTPVAPPVTSTPAADPPIVTRDARPTQRPVKVDGSRPRSPASEDSNTLKWIAGGALAAGAAVAIVAAADSGGGGGSTPPPADPPMDPGGGTDTNMTGTVTCASSDAIGIWQSANPSAPGFQLNPDFSAQFFTAPSEPLDQGSWRIAACNITLSPTSNNVYQGTGTLSDNKTTIDLQGIRFFKTN